MSMKFGGKQSIVDKMAVADALLGKHTGASKGSKPQLHVRLSRPNPPKYR